MENIPTYPMPAAEERAAMAKYYGSMYPPVACEFYTHVVRVCDEMDDPVHYPMMPRDRFEAMTDRIMSSLENEYDFSDDCDNGYALQQQPFRRRHRRRDLARGLVISLLIAELLRRRRF